MFSGRFTIAVVITAALVHSSALAREPQQSTNPREPASTDVSVAREAATGSTTGNDAADAARTQEPGFVDKVKQWAEEKRIVDRLSGDVDGWYPRLGGMTRGSGFGIGPGYRFHMGDVFVDLSAAYSLKAYKAVDANVRWLRAYDQRLELWTNYRFEDFPQEDFFGMGLDTVREARTSYDFDSHDVNVEGRFKATRWLSLSTRVGLMGPDINEGTDDKYPSIEQLFTDGDAPGLADQPRYLHTTFTGDVDYRDEPGNPRGGGLYRAAFGIWDDTSLEQYNFKRFDLLLRQFMPLGSEKAHVVSGTFGVSYVNNSAGNRVPFYFLPYVGGVDTVRSLHEFRFKDENALWMSGEYRWIPFKYVSFATFFDAGKVARNYEDLHSGEFKKGYGFGVRVHTRRQTFARIDMATGGGEGWKVFLKLGPRS
jgi:outer membrane protein assembly factor BamA